MCIAWRENLSVSMVAIVNNDFHSFSKPTKLELSKFFCLDKIFLRFKDPGRCYIPKRFIVAFLGFFGLVNAFTMRVNLSVAMVAMVNNTEENAKVFNSSGDECPNFMEANDDSTRGQSSSLGEKYDWDARTQGMIMSSFFYAYFVTMLTGGYFAKRFGAKLMFGAGVGATSILTLLTPVAVRWGVIPFIIVRALEGVGEGLTYPAINTMVSQWAPKLERSRISSAVFSGASIGTVLSFSASGMMCKSEALGGWPSAFYVFGAIGSFWYVLWTIFIYETPDEHPTISKEELFLIYESEENQLPHKDLYIPWRKIFTSLPMWAVLFGNFGSYFGLAVLTTELPSYLSGVLHYSVEASGLLTGLPNLFEALGAIMSSYVADKLISSKRLSVTTVRKIFHSMGMVGSGICLLAITVSGCQATLIIVLYSLLLYVNGFKYSGFHVNHVEIYPPLAGILLGMTNSISSLSGIIVPNMTGAFTASGNTRTNWNKVFYVTAGIYFISTILYDIFASAELQPWGLEKKGKKQSSISETKN
ncbi:Sialin [Araneus ventricosus]|uniref:Sialin n=1 Tax=Araneus ventricosus TaxID=182803 RepID=A0A4Y2GUC2_ARAVE|nr:Sialin [Araneus ventricosus]